MLISLVAFLGACAFVVREIRKLSSPYKTFEEVMKEILVEKSDTKKYADFFDSLNRGDYFTTHQLYSDYKIDYETATKLVAQDLVMSSVVQISSIECPTCFQKEDVEASKLLNSAHKCLTCRNTTPITGEIIYTRFAKV